MRLNGQILLYALALLPIPDTSQLEVKIVHLSRRIVLFIKHGSCNIVTKESYVQISASSVKAIDKKGPPNVLDIDH